MPLWFTARVNCLCTCCKRKHKPPGVHYRGSCCFPSPPNRIGGPARLEGVACLVGQFGFLLFQSFVSQQLSGRRTNMAHRRRGTRGPCSQSSLVHYKEDGMSPDAHAPRLQSPQAGLRVHLFSYIQKKMGLMVRVLRAFGDLMKQRAPGSGWVQT